MKVPININPKGGIDLDSDPRSIPNGFIRNALNCRWGIHNDSNGVVENVRGNTKLIKTDNNLLTGFTSIGSCEDIPRKSVVWFLFNKGSNHAILKYDTKNELVVPILWNAPILNFNLSHRIYNPKVVDNGDEGLLIWTDGFNPPRKINIRKARELTKLQYPNLFKELQLNEGIGFWTIGDDFVVQ